MNKVSCTITASSALKVKADLYVSFHPTWIADEKVEFISSSIACISDLVKKKELHSGNNFELFVNGCFKNSSVHHAIIRNESFNSISKTEAREKIRFWIGKIIRYAENNHLSTIAISLPSHAYLDSFCIVQDMATTAAIAHYQFNEFITDIKRKITGNLSLVFLDIPEENHLEMNKILKKADSISTSVNIARNWADLPPSLLNPEAFAQSVKDTLSLHDFLKIKIFEKEHLEANKMGGILNVCRGSMYDPRMVVVEYACQKKDAPTIALVGKGVTFDTGGISIKPADNMENMKSDMAGAAAVMATMNAIALLKPDINVIACTPMVENMPSGTAVKPGDIITFYNGKTAEIKNTDAEGRLILADALSYISKNYKVDMIVDAATLTGACSVALGPFYAALMSQHKKHATQLFQAGLESGDKVWELPMHNDYRKAIDSDVADICNIGKSNYKAGTITAGFFLKEFVPHYIPWIHLDIAGVAMHVPDRSYYHAVGATGFGVRLFTEFICNSEYHSCLKN